MSGSFYTPYSFGGGSPGSAFRSGFAGAQELERNAQQLEEADQLMKLRQLQNERTQAAEARAAQLFPLQYSASELALKRGAQLNPLEIEKMQLDLQRLRTELGNAASTRAGGAQVPSMLEVPIIAPAPAPSPAGMYVRPPPSGGAGQASLDVTPQQYFAADDPRFTGERRFAGIQVASAGINDATGLPTGITPEMVAGTSAAPTTSTAPAAPTANPRLMEAAFRELSISPALQTPAMIEQVATQYGIDPDALASRFGVTLPPRPEPIQWAPNAPLPGPNQSMPFLRPEPPRPPVPFTPQAGAYPDITPSELPQRPEGQLPQSRLDFTPASTTTQQAGVTPPGEQSISQLTTELTNSIERLTAIQRPEMSFMSESQVGREREALQRAAANLEQRRRALVLLSRSNPGLAYQEGVKLQAEVEVLRTNEANLNGRIALSEFASGRPERLAADINRASGGVLRLEVNQDGTYNIWGREGEESPRAVNVKASDLLHQGRMMYDNNYKSQIDAIRTQNTERNNQIFKAFTDGLSETIKQRANMSRETAVKFAEEQAKAQYRAPNYDVKVDSTAGSITITNTQTGESRTLRQVPAKDRNGRTIQGQYEFVPVETRATTAQ